RMMCGALTALVSTTYNRCRSVEGAGSTIDRQALPVTDMINTVDQDCRGEDRERQAGQSDGGHTVADGGFDDAGGDQEEHADRPDGARPTCGAVAEQLVCRSGQPDAVGDNGQTDEEHDAGGDRLSAAADPEERADGQHGALLMLT